MATERHEIQCGVCGTWYPMRGMFDAEYPPAGWLTLSYQPEDDNDEVPELGICSVACLGSKLVERWVVSTDREHSDD